MAEMLIMPLLTLVAEAVAAADSRRSLTTHCRIYGDALVKHTCICTYLQILVYIFKCSN